jgi:hypothetical protein
MTSPAPTEEVEGYVPPHEREWPSAWQRPFLYSLGLIPNVSAALRTANVSKTHAFRVRRENADFAAAWEEALGHARDLIERQAHTWITTGVPVRSRRTVTKTRTLADGTVESTTTEVVESDSAERSATLMIFWLKAHYPETYRWSDRHEITGAEGGPLQFETVDEIDRKIAALTEELEREAQGQTVPDE